MKLQKRTSRGFKLNHDPCRKTFKVPTKDIEQKRK